MDNSKEIEGLKKSLDKWIDKKNMLLLAIGKASDATQIFQLTDNLKEAEENIEEQKQELQRLEKTTSTTQKQNKDIFSLLQDAQPQTELEKKQHQIQFEEFMSKAYEDFYKKIGEEESLFNLFEVIISDAELNQMQKQRITELVKNNTHFSLKCIIVASLMLRGIKTKLDEFTIELLIDFVLQEEENVWQRALVGLIFSLYNKDKRISKKLKRRLNELKEIDRVQEGIYYFSRFYYELDFPKKKKIILYYKELLANGKTVDEAINFLTQKSDLPQRDTIFLTKLVIRQHHLMDKPQYWFMPFYTDNKVVKEALENCEHNIETDKLANLLQESIRFTDIDKYSICITINQMLEVGSFIEKLGDEKNNISSMKINKSHLMWINYGKNIRPFLESIFDFQNFYSDTKLNLLIEETNLIQQQGLLILISTIENNNQIESDYYFALGSNSKNRNEKIENYEKSLEKKSDNYIVLYELGNIYDESENYNKAIFFYRKAIEIKGNEPKIWNRLGSAYYDKKKYKKATECFEKILEIEPNFENILYNLACLYSLQNQTGKSLSYLGKSILLDSTLKSEAKKYEGFKNLWQDKDFLALVGE
jgi:tetratricopeptide (TPR) repeat protein